MRNIFFLFISFFFVEYAFGQDLSLHGFIQGNYTARVTGTKLYNSEGGDYILGEERIQFTLSGYSQSGSADFFIKSDFFHDGIINKAKTDIREAYIDYISDFYDLRIGRQIITWGVGDLLFINDIFPKDWGAFFSGRPLEYLKIGSNAFKINVYSPVLSIELLAMPFFEEDALPSNQRFFLYNPYPQSAIKNFTRPVNDINNTELALRLYRQIEKFDLSVYSYKGFFRSPGVRINSFDSQLVFNYFYPELAVYGFSATRGLQQGVLSLEAGYYDSIDERDGTNPGISNSLTKFLIGYQRQLWSDFTINTQFYGEYMHKYERYKKNPLSGFPPQDRVRQMLTFRLTQLMKYQTVKLSLFTFYGISDNDYMIIPEFYYKIDDEMWIALGGNVFGGKYSHTSFGQLNKNDNIYLTVRFEF